MLGPAEGVRMCGQAGDPVRSVWPLGLLCWGLLLRLLLWWAVVSRWLLWPRVSLRWLFLLQLGGSPFRLSLSRRDLG